MNAQWEMFATLSHSIDLVALITDVKRLFVPILLWVCANMIFLPNSGSSIFDVRPYWLNIDWSVYVEAVAEVKFIKTLSNLQCKYSTVLYFI